MSQTEVYQFLEILIQYLKLNRTLMGKIDSSQLMQLTCSIYLNDTVVGMSFSQLGGFYWLCSNLGPYWDVQTI